MDSATIIEIVDEVFSALNVVTSNNPLENAVLGLVKKIVDAELPKILPHILGNLGVK